MIDERLLRRVSSNIVNIDDFNFDRMTAPPLYSMIAPEEVDYIRKLVSSAKYAAKIDFKYSEIDKILKARGFVKLSAGTNRVVYRCLFDQSIVLKIAIDYVGMEDNPREFENQQYLKPFVCKVFEVSPCGTIAVVERVRNIKSREEFMTIANDVYTLLTKFIIGNYVMEDIGTKYFMNYGVRKGFGPVLLDYPYLYELDGNKLYCNQSINGHRCDGEIDYDDGFNTMYCCKCGTVYNPVDLKKMVAKSLVLEKGKGEGKMEDFRVIVKRGDKIIKTSDDNGTRKISRRERNFNSVIPVSETLVCYRVGGDYQTNVGKKVTEALDKCINMPEFTCKPVGGSNCSREDDKVKDNIIRSTFIPTEETEEDEEEVVLHDMDSATYNKVESLLTDMVNRVCSECDEVEEEPTDEEYFEVRPEVSVPESNNDEEESDEESDSYDDTGNDYEWAESQMDIGLCVARDCWEDKAIRKFFGDVVFADDIERKYYLDEEDAKATDWVIVDIVEEDAEEDDSVFNSIPVGAVPVGTKRSRRFDKDFYEKR